MSFPANPCLNTKEFTTTMTTGELLLQSIAKDIRQLHPLDDDEIDLLRRAAGLKSDEGKIIVDGLAKIDVVVPEVAVENETQPRGNRS